MTPPGNARPIGWVILVWTLWILILACGTFWYANGRGTTRTLLFLAVTLPILAVWLIAWKKSIRTHGD